MGHRQSGREFSCVTRWCTCNTVKKVKEALALPLSLMLRKSIDEGKIPDILKLAYVMPIHKGGSRQKLEQYRPVSLTAHVMKVFERVMKKKIEHLKKKRKKKKKKPPKKKKKKKKKK